MGRREAAQPKARLNATTLAHRLLSRSGQGVVGVGPVRRQSIASPNAVRPGRTPNLGRGLYHLRPRIELIADDEIGRGLAFAALIRAGGRGMRAGRLVWSGI